jgi:hypothetical protein
MDFVLNVHESFKSFQPGVFTHNDADNQDPEPLPFADYNRQV